MTTHGSYSTDQRTRAAGVAQTLGTMDSGIPGLRLSRGDHLQVDRGLYHHHGIFVSPQQVIHFSGTPANKGSDMSVKSVSIQEFVGTAGPEKCTVVQYGTAYTGTYVQLCSCLGASWEPPRHLHAMPTPPPLPVHPQAPTATRATRLSW